MDWLTRGVDTLLVVLFLVMVVVITWQVFARYVLESPTRWSEELARFLVVWVTMLGSAVVLRGDGHVAVTAIVERLPGIVRHVALFVRDAIVIASAGTLGWYGYLLAEHAGRQTAPGLGISMSWAYAAIPAGALLTPLFLLGARLLDREPGRGG
jgi:TRAP-type transport system small permease protein